MEESQEEDLHVEDQGPMLDIIEVVLDPPLDGGVSSPTVDLSPTGHTRLDFVAEHIAWDMLPELFDEDRSLRSRTNQ